MMKNQPLSSVRTSLEKKNELAIWRGRYSKKTTEGLLVIYMKIDCRTSSFPEDRLAGTIAGAKRIFSTNRKRTSMRGYQRIPLADGFRPMKFESSQGNKIERR